MDELRQQMDKMKEQMKQRIGGDLADKPPKVIRVTRPQGLLLQPESAEGGVPVDINPENVVIEMGRETIRMDRVRGVSSAPEPGDDGGLEPEEAATQLIKFIYEKVSSRISDEYVPSQTLMNYIAADVDQIYKMSGNNLSPIAIEILKRLSAIAGISGAYTATTRFDELREMAEKKMAEEDLRTQSEFEFASPAIVESTPDIPRSSSAPKPQKKHQVYSRSQKKWYPVSNIDKKSEDKWVVDYGDDAVHFSKNINPKIPEEKNELKQGFFGGRRKTKRHKKSKKSKKKHKKSKKAHRRKKSKKTKRPKRSKK